MIPKEEKEQLIQKSRELSREIISLQNELSNVSEQKETVFRQKEAVTKEILSLISEVKDFKQKRNELTKKVRESKKKRDESNSDVRKKIDEIKKVKLEKDKLIQKAGLDEDPGYMRKKIEILEMKQQTEPMSFAKEKELMKTVKAIKAKLDKVKSLGAVFEKSQSISHEIDELRGKTENIHKAVQQTAQESQNFHEQIIEKSKRIDELKVKEEELYKKFFQLKSKFNEANELLKQKLVHMGEISKKIGAEKKEIEHTKEDNTRKTISEKKRAVEQKLKTGGKITTEDLLVMQQ